MNKRYFKVCTILISLLIAVASHAQLIKTADDAQLLTTHEQEFVNKPLKILLKEIKPPIKMVTANPSSNNQIRVGYFAFRFIDKNKYDSIRSKKKYPLEIVVYVKEPFQWDERGRQIAKKTYWTKEDEEKYGNLTVLGIRVHGKNEP